MTFDKRLEIKVTPLTLNYDGSKHVPLITRPQKSKWNVITQIHHFIKTGQHAAASLVVWLQARILFAPIWPCQSKGVVLWSANTAIKRRGWGAVLWSAAKQSLDVFTERTLLGLWNTVPFSLSFNLCFLHPPLLPHPPFSSQGLLYTEWCWLKPLNTFHSSWACYSSNWKSEDVLTNVTD